MQTMAIRRPFHTLCTSKFYFVFNLLESRPVLEIIKVAEKRASRKRETDVWMMKPLRGSLKNQRDDLKIVESESLRRGSVADSSSTYARFCHVLLRSAHIFLHLLLFCRIWTSTSIILLKQPMFSDNEMSWNVKFCNYWVSTELRDHVNNNIACLQVYLWWICIDITVLALMIRKMTCKLTDWRRFHRFTGQFWMADVIEQ